jgi:hypothetical protein
VNIAIGQSRSRKATDVQASSCEANPLFSGKDSRRIIGLRKACEPGEKNEKSRLATRKVRAARVLLEVQQLGSATASGEFENGRLATRMSLRQRSGASEKLNGCW